MRASALAFVLAVALVPAAAFAQAGPPPNESGPPPGGPPGASAAPPPGAITRDQFVQRRAEAAGRLFDRIDTNHVGYITRAQMHAYTAAHRRRGPAGGAPPEEQ
jgi:hypothetical protein